MTPKSEAKANPPDSSSAQVAITYYTDPLCCWSWGFEPQWRRLRYEFGDQLSWRYVMGGMLQDWHTFNDPLNAISRPVQMGPLWFQTRTISGMPINEQIWFEDPPTSSFQSCIAFKAAEQQSPMIAEQYLRRLREAVMVKRRNISRREVLIHLAGECARALPDCSAFDLQQFAEDLNAPQMRGKFGEDIKNTQYHNVGRFPTLVIRRPGGSGIIIVGYRPYEILLEAVHSIAPNLQAIRQNLDIVDYLAYWGSATTREVAELTGENIYQAEQQLKALTQQSLVICEDAAQAPFYALAC